MLRSLNRIALAIVLISPLLPTAIAAEPCSREMLRRVVDEAGARLRVITAETQPRIMAALRRLKEKRGWTGADGDEKAAAFMSDERTSEFDAKAATLLALIDELGETSAPGDPQCSRLAELEAASLELQATIRAKARHILSKLEREVGVEGTDAPTAKAPPPAPDPALSKEARPARPEPPSKAEAAPAPAEKPAGEADSVRRLSPETPLRRADEIARVPPPPSRPADPAPVERAKPLPPVPGTRPEVAATAPPVKPKANSSWSTETSERTPLPPPMPAPVAPPRPAPPAQQPPQGLPPLQQEPSESFTRDEIREASRGFFGTISGGLASVIEHAFSTLGRPTGYVLGNEGGGAFIAGLRYGKGTLFLRDGSKREVYWHGPSIGYDFGAAGSKTMFLVYNLKNDIDIFSGFSGVEGSAYLVGGVGMTALTNGSVIMAPIRSGLGLRFGANIGYIRFTARPTWNPF